MAALDHQVITSLLLAVLSTVLLMSMAAVMFILRWRYRKILKSEEESPVPDSYTPTTPLHRPLFVPRRAATWLAIRSGNLMAVQTALSLHNPKPCSLADGLSNGSERGLFISPPVSGWILVIGPSLPDPFEDVDICYRFLAELSRKLGHVQFFSANPLFNHHAWARLESGNVHRAYAWAGVTLWNQGIPTPAELRLNLKCFGYGDSPERPLFGAPDPCAGNADKLHLLAARWSLDPDQIDEQVGAQEWGVLGNLSGPF
jgi:hypothetical protein